MKKSELVYYIHSIVIILSYFSIIAITSLFFWILFYFELLWQFKLLIFCISFSIGIFATNHAFNDNSLCVLQSLENYYRKKEGLEEHKMQAMVRFNNNLKHRFRKTKKVFH